MGQSRVWERYQVAAAGKPGEKEIVGKGGDLERKKESMTDGGSPTRFSLETYRDKISEASNIVGRFVFLFSLLFQ